MTIGVGGDKKPEHITASGNLAEARVRKYRLPNLRREGDGPVSGLRRG